MNISVKKNIFILFFACFQVLLAFSYLTSYEYIVTGLFLFFLIVIKFLFKIKIVLEPKLSLVFILFLVSLIISSFYTHSIPLTIETLYFYFTTFSVFVFVRSLLLSKICNKSDFGLFFIVISIVFSLFFIVFFSFSELAHFLPSINIFTLEFGHSHFAPLLLLFIPVAWWFFYSSKYKDFRFRWILLVLLYVLLGLSFGRFAILLGLFQVVYIHFFLIKKSKINKIIYFLLGFFLILLTSLLFFSFTTKIDCSNFLFKDQVCKNILNEYRIYYFEQAISAFKDYPLYGYGPGTFKLITEKYNSIAEHSSAYTHNVFLEIFAESGIITGSLFVLLIFTLLRVSYIEILNDRKLNKDKSFFEELIFLGVFSLLLNSFIDFDWDLLPIFLFTFIFIALLLGDNIPKTKSIYDNFISFVWLLLTLFVVTYGFLSCITKILISRKNINIAFDIFPYFTYQSQVYLDNHLLSPIRNQNVFYIYRNHPEILLKKISNTDDPYEKTLIYESLVERDISIFNNRSYKELLYETNEHDLLFSTIIKSLEIIKAERDKESKTKRSEKSNTLYLAHLLAINFLENGDIDKALILYEPILENFYKIENENELYYLYQDYIQSDVNWEKNIVEFYELLSIVDINLSKEKLYQLLDIYEGSYLNKNQEGIFYSEKLSLVIINMANIEFENGHFEESAELYKLASKFNKWIFNIAEPRFVIGEIQNSNDKKIFWDLMRDFDPMSYVHYSDFVMNQYDEIDKLNY